MRSLLLILLCLPAIAQGQVQFTTSCDSLTLGTDLGSCEATTVIDVEAVTDCYIQDLVSYHYGLDLNADGNIDLQGSSPSFNHVLSIGRHKVYFVVTDPCNTVDSCITEILVVDQEAPEQDCIPHLQVDVEPNTEKVYVNSNMFNVSATDNCVSAEHIFYLVQRVDIDDNPLSPVKTFYELSCEDIGENYFRQWAYDQAYEEDYFGNITIHGNGSYCLATLIVGNSLGGCDGFAACNIFVIPQLSDSSSFEQETCITLHTIIDSVAYPCQSPHNILQDACGIREGTFQIDISSPDSTYLGISTWDIVQIRKHILNVDPFDSVYKAIAADVNGDGVISTIDIVFLRKLILDKDDHIPIKKVWRFAHPNLTWDDYNSGNYELDRLTYPQLINPDPVLYPRAIRMGDMDNN